MISCREFTPVIVIILWILLPNILADIQGNLPHLYIQLLSKFEIQKKLISYKTKARYWESQFSKFKSREDELKTEIEELKAQLRKREQQLFGKKSEKGIARPDKVTQTKSKKTWTTTKR